MQELISIIIPIFNCEKYINRCMKSVVTQSYNPIEIILIDDGSTDNSSVICDEWACQDKRVNVVHQINQGAATARNRGLDIATGDYIMFVDADDYLSSDICEVLISNFLRDTDLDCAISGSFLVDEEGHKISKSISVNKPMLMSGIDAIKTRYLCEKNEINIIEPWGKLFKKSIWENLRFTDGIYYEDMDIVPYLYIKCEKILFIPYAGYNYCQRIGSASNGIGTDDKRVIDSLNIRKKHINFYYKAGEKELSQCITRRCLDFIITCDCNGWIPSKHIKKYKETFRELYGLGFKGASLKDKVRFLIYNYGGSRVYKLLKRG